MQEMIDKVLANPFGQGVAAVFGIAVGTFVVYLLARLVKELVGFLRPKAKQTPTDLDDRALNAIENAADEAKESALQRIAGFFAPKPKK